MSDVNCSALSTTKGLNAAQNKSWDAANELHVRIFGKTYPESEASYKKRYKEGICKKRIRQV